MKDRRIYTLQERNEIVAYDITTGEKTQTIFDPIQVEGDILFQGQLSNYIFSEDETLILLATKREQVYRRSYFARSEEHTSELQSRGHLVCRLLLEKKKQ